MIFFSPQNYVRVVEVWWDEYKDYFYASRPESKALAYGDISELKKFREDHNCKSFKWFMEEIAYDITSHYPLPPKNVDWGEVSISSIQIAKCMCLETWVCRETWNVWGRSILRESLGKSVWYFLTFPVTTTLSNWLCVPSSLHIWLL